MIIRLRTITTMQQKNERSIIYDVTFRVQRDGLSSAGGDGLSSVSTEFLFLKQLISNKKYSSTKI